MVEQHRVALEEAPDVPGGNGSPVLAVGSTPAPHHVLPGQRRVEVWPTVQNGSAGRPEHDAGGHEVPLHELTGGEALAHLDARARPEIDQVEPLLGSDPRHLVGAQVRQAHALEIADLARAQVGTFAHEDLLGDRVTDRERAIEHEPLEVRRRALLERHGLPELVLGAALRPGVPKRPAGCQVSVIQLRTLREAEDPLERALALGPGEGALRGRLLDQAALLVLSPAAAGAGVVSADLTHGSAWAALGTLGSI